MSRKGDNMQNLKRSLDLLQTEEMIETAAYPGTYPFGMDGGFDDPALPHQQISRLGQTGRRELQHQNAAYGLGEEGVANRSSAKRSRLTAHDAASASAAAISAAISPHDAVGRDSFGNYPFAHASQFGGVSSAFGGAAMGGDEEEIESLQRLQLLKMQNAAMQNRLMAAANTSRTKRTAASAMMEGMGGRSSLMRSSDLGQSQFGPNALSSIYASQRTAASLSAAAHAAQLPGGSGARGDAGNDPFLSSAFSSGQATGLFGMHDVGGSDAEGEPSRGFSSDGLTMAEMNPRGFGSSGMGAMAMGSMAQRRLSNQGMSDLATMAQRRLSNQGMTTDFVGMAGMGRRAQRRFSNEFNPFAMGGFSLQQQQLGAASAIGMGSNLAVGQRHLGRGSPSSSLDDSIPNVSAQLKKLKRGQAKKRDQFRSGPGSVAASLRKFDGKWGERYEQLIQYKRENGDCLVPDGYAANPKLARWVREQRGQFKNLRDGKPSHMTQERMTALNEIGFTWSLREKVDWKDRFEELVDYKCKHGDCLVPTNYAPNAQLGTWVANQRKHYRLMKEGKRSIMTPERVKYLEKIGFQWSIRPSGNRKKEGDT